MKDFNIAKYLKEHNLGSYGILNHYVDIKPLKEEEDEVELNTEIPYEGPDQKLTGNGEGDEFDQAETVSENEYGDESDFNRIMDLGGNQIERGIISLMDDGFPAEDVLELCRMFIEDQYGAKARGQNFEEIAEERFLNEAHYQIGQISSKSHTTSDLEKLGLKGVTSRQTGTGKWVLLVKKTAENEKILKAKGKPYKEYKD